MRRSLSTLSTFLIRVSQYAWIDVSGVLNSCDMVATNVDFILFTLESLSVKATSFSSFCLSSSMILALRIPITASVEIVSSVSMT